MGYKCEVCGRYFLDPIPHKCNKCSTTIPNGTDEGDLFQRNSKVRSGTIRTHPTILERLPLQWGHFVEFLSDWNDEGDTSNVPKVRR
jgi:hypothetical protein